MQKKWFCSSLAFGLISSSCCLAFWSACSGLVAFLPHGGGAVSTRRGRLRGMAVRVGRLLGIGAASSTRGRLRGGGMAARVGRLLGTGAAGTNRRLHGVAVRAARPLSAGTVGSFVFAGSGSSPGTFAGAAAAEHQPSRRAGAFTGAASAGQKSLRPSGRLARRVAARRLAAAPQVVDLAAGRLAAAPPVADLASGCFAGTPRAAESAAGHPAAAPKVADTPAEEAAYCCELRGCLPRACA